MPDTFETPDGAIVIYGARGHAQVVADAILEGGRKVFAFLDDDESIHGSRRLDYAIHGFDFLETAAKAHVALGVGDNSARQAIAERCVRAGFELTTVVHPTAYVGRAVTIGKGVVILAHAVINTNAAIGDGAIINTAAVVEHDVVVGSFAHVSPNAVLAGGARLGDGSHLGVGAVVLDDITVGSHTVIGAGSVVTRAIADYTVAYGVPARAMRGRRHE